MKNTILEQRIKELELEIQHLKSSKSKANTITKYSSAEREDKLNQNNTSESLFQTLFTDGYSIKLIIDSETGQIVDANKSACSFYGYSHDEIIKKNISEINLLTDEQVHEEMKSAKLNKRNHFNFKQQLKNGEIKEVEVLSGKIEVENKSYLYSDIIDVTEKKKTEQELIKTKEKAEKRAEENVIKYRLIVENQNDLIAIIDADKTLKYVSPNYCKTFGVNEDEILGTSFFPFVHPDDRELVTKSLETLTKPPHSSYHEERAKTVSGWRWFAWSVKAVFDGNEIFETIAVGRDISEKKEFEFELQQAKEKAEENEEKYRRLIENSNSIIMEVDMDTLEIINCNSQLAKLFNKNVSDFIGVDLRQILPTDVLQRRIEYAEKALLENKVQQFKDERNGKHFLHSYIPYKTHNNRFVQTETHDITLLENAKQELIKAKEKAEESKNFLQTIFENIPNMIFLKNADDLSFAFFNKAGEKLLGYKSEELIGKNDYDFFPKEQADFFVEKDRNVLKGKEILSIEEEEISTKSGKRYLSTKKTTIHNSEGKPKYLFGISEDITKYKESEQELIRAKEQAENANRLKTEFLHNMSHEIRTPLNGIMGFAEILNNPNISEDKRKNYSKIIRNSGAQLLRVVDDILEIATLETKQTKLDESEFCLND
ncbi:MAG: PAS domain S-box protein, partial [Bacteroidales bacterium]|nr:PAS domain S-box protein [Bacteroidales bacterium]